MQSESSGVAFILEVTRAGLPILTIALTCAAYIVVGITLVHLGNASALAFRDITVGDANRIEPASPFGVALCAPNHAGFSPLKGFQ